MVERLGSLTQQVAVDEEATLALLQFVSRAEAGDTLERCPLRSSASSFACSLHAERADLAVHVIEIAAGPDPTTWLDSARAESSCSERAAVAGRSI